MSFGAINDGGEVGGVMRPVSDFFGDLGERLGTDSVGDGVESGIDNYDEKYGEWRGSIDVPSPDFSGLKTAIAGLTGLVGILAVMYVAGQLFEVHVGGGQ